MVEAICLIVCRYDEISPTLSSPRSRQTNCSEPPASRQTNCSVETSAWLGQRVGVFGPWRLSADIERRDKSNIPHPTKHKARPCPSPTRRSKRIFPKPVQSFTALLESIYFFRKISLHEFT